jgi:TolA-binding protein
MPGSKIDALNLRWNKIKSAKLDLATKAPVYLMIAGVFFGASGCVMTKTQGDKLHGQVQNLEDEVAKLQRVRHDMEVLLVGQVRDLVDRMARFERQLATLRESLTEDSSKSTELVAEVQTLRSELEQAQQHYKNLEAGQQSLAKNQQVLKEAHNKIRIPPLKEDHFAQAKKYYLGGQFDEAVFLFDQLVKNYPDEKDLVGQSYYLLGEIYRKLGDGEKSPEEAEKNYKKSVVSYQKITEMYKDAILREEALFKMGSVLKLMGNTEGAKAAYNELLLHHKKSKRASEAKALLSELESKAK